MTAFCFYVLPMSLRRAGATAEEPNDKMVIYQGIINLGLTAANNNNKMKRQNSGRIVSMADLPRPFTCASTNFVSCFPLLQIQILIGH